MTQHTKGPWYVKAGKSGYSIKASGMIMRQDKTIAIVPDKGGAQANAALIAAAPDLLEALKILIDAREEDRLADQEEYNRGRAAIAKAEGQQ